MGILRLGPSATFVAAAGLNNNVDPGSVTTLNRLLVNTAAGVCSFSGIVAGLDGQLLWIKNTGANLLTLLNANGGSTAANRFDGAGDINVPSGDSVMIYYDTALTRWIIAI